MKALKLKSLIKSSLNEDRDNEQPVPFEILNDLDKDNELKQAFLPVAKLFRRKFKELCKKYNANEQDVVDAFVDWEIGGEDDNSLIGSLFMTTIVKMPFDSGQRREQPI